MAPRRNQHRACRGPKVYSHNVLNSSGGEPATTSAAFDAAATVVKPQLQPRPQQLLPSFSVGSSSLFGMALPIVAALPMVSPRLVTSESQSEPSTSSATAAQWISTVAKVVTAATAVAS
ncbi:hypothetical protein F503_08723 [Ophiostoma piceae UAMH 11346]|uniref:Uncharacterized protein n=1 Tax=Ophiostoma piceae (strain UAMH 11346) TaxID=1262450 RepID=S3BPA5_OPHP1|nr:hypothetical protein F503_08723 [Ophiostoma piceae UAMH 11346]